MEGDDGTDGSNCAFAETAKNPVGITSIRTTSEQKAVIFILYRLAIHQARKK
jgi:hypothetical protein